jgi:ABC-type transport system substrate-binding protein
MHQAQQEVVGIPRGQVDFRPPNPAQQGYYQGGGYYDPGQYYQQGYNNGYQPGYGGYYGGASGGYYAGAGYGGYQDETVFYPLPQAAAVEEKRQSVESEGVEEIKQSIKDL